MNAEDSIQDGSIMLHDRHDSLPPYSASWLANETDKSTLHVRRKKLLHCQTTSLHQGVPPVSIHPFTHAPLANWLADSRAAVKRGCMRARR